MQIYGYTFEIRTTKEEMAERSRIDTFIELLVYINKKLYK